ncbi:MAG: ABC transporter permease [Synergistaceae bacterium]|jgi:sulfonate transport system permease protein|nr:ABC transporter permease [Synergistaceae bacterium]
MNMGKKKNISDLFFFSLIVPAILVVIWELACNYGLIRMTILPSPSRVFDAFMRQIANGSLQKNIAVSLRRVIFGYALGASLGVTLGTMMGLFTPLEKSLRFLLEILRPIPIIAWVPVMILWSGIGERSKIIVIAIGTFWTVLINVIDGIRNVDKKYIEVSTIFMKSRLDVITKVVLPAASPNIFTGLRIGVGSAWISVVGAELIAASSGLGFLISYSRELAQPASMLVGVFTIGVIGWVINRLLHSLERFLLKWNINIR